MVTVIPKIYNLSPIIFAIANSISMTVHFPVSVLFDCRYLDVSVWLDSPSSALLYLVWRLERPAGDLFAFVHISIPSKHLPENKMTMLIKITNFGFERPATHVRISIKAYYRGVRHPTYSSTPAWREGRRNTHCTFVLVEIRMAHMKT